MYLGGLHDILKGIKIWPIIKARGGLTRAKTCTSSTGTPSFRTATTWDSGVRIQCNFRDLLRGPMLKDSQNYSPICGLKASI